MSSTIENEVAEYNVIIATCKTTGFRFISARKDTIKTFRSRLIASVNNPSPVMGGGMQLVQSAIKYGEEDHSYVSYGPYTKTVARKEKLRLAIADAIEVGTLNATLPREGMPEDTHQIVLTPEASEVPKFKDIKPVRERNLIEVPAANDNPKPKKVSKKAKQEM